MLLTCGSIVGLAGCGGGGGGATATPVGKREPTTEEHANLLIARTVLAENGFAELAGAFDSARFFVADRIVPGDNAPAYWQDLAGYTIGGEVVLKYTVFPRYQAGMNETVRVTAHELAHFLGADEPGARTTEATVLQKMRMADSTGSRQASAPAK